MTTLDDLIKDDFDANENDAFPDEGSITGDRRTEARVLALQAIFQHVFVNQPLNKVRDEFVQFYVRQHDAEKKILVAILDDVADHQERYEQLIANNLNQKWTYDRIGLVEKSLLIAATSELSLKSAPAKVVINEYINIAKGYFDPKTVGFINGILNTLTVLIHNPDSEEAEKLKAEAAARKEVVDANTEQTQEAIEAKRKEVELENEKARELALKRREEKRAVHKERTFDENKFKKKD